MPLVTSFFVDGDTRSDPAESGTSADVALGCNTAAAVLDGSAVANLTFQAAGAFTKNFPFSVDTTSLSVPFAGTYKVHMVMVCDNIAGATLQRQLRCIVEKNAQGVVPDEGQENIEITAAEVVQISSDTIFDCNAGDTISVIAGQLGVAVGNQTSVFCRVTIHKI